MWINTALFAAGILLCQQLNSLPHLYWSIAVLLLMLVAISLAFRHSEKVVLPLLLFGVGFAWAVIYGHWKLHGRLPAELVKQPLLLTGSIVELPLQNRRDWRFVFEPDSALHKDKPVKVPDRIRLSWYKTDFRLHSGQRWQLLVKLKPPTGSLNPGLFDYEGWLFLEGIGARGYVVDSPDNQLLGDSNGLPGFDELREHVRFSLASFTEFPSASALVTALTVGDKSRISQQSWDSFRALGINHLVAISGLHVGMIVMLVYWSSGRLWRLSDLACQWVPAPRLQAVVGLIAAVLYAGMAGFSLPTQRALVMIAVVLLARILLINMQAFRQLAIAVFILLLWEPPAVSAPGFWLSFMAVTAIFLSMAKKDDSTQESSTPTTGQRLLLKTRELLLMQWNITLLLLPFSLLFFKQVSIVSAVANLVLIPLFSFFVVPAALLMTLLNLLGITVIENLFINYLEIIEWLLDLLQAISGSDWLVFQAGEFSVYRFALLMLAIMFWYYARLRFHKLSAMLIMLAALLLPSLGKPEKQLHVTVLDIGQGTSVLLETAGRVLLYDLGPRYASGNSATMSVVVPFLRNRGIGKVDLLVISHSDSDHAGDLAGFLQAVNVEKIVSGEFLNSSREVDLCQAGQVWRWQQTIFEFLSPGQRPVQDNNASCVLRVVHGENRLLLTGDIERSAERKLLTNAADKLAAEVVLVPHHGSKSSSGEKFVKAVDARLVINSSAHLNRYGFPDGGVKKRWQQNGAEFLDTGESGALQLALGRKAGDIAFDTFMQRYRKYWHWPR